MRSSVDNNYDGRILVVPRTGNLLVSQPALQDPVFERSVVMMMDVDLGEKNTGSMALMLNKCLESVDIHDVFNDWHFQGPTPHLFLGGPVDHERLFVLHKLGERLGDCVEVCEGVYIGGDIDLIKEYVEGGYPVEGIMRFFLGYCGWGSQQLKDELEENVWAVARLTANNKANLLVGSGEDYWRRVVSEMGDAYHHWLSIPQHPEFN